MRLRTCFISAFTAVIPFVVILFCGGAASVASAQNKDVNLALHANSHASAAGIGLPAYPGATLYKDGDNDSGADLGLTAGDFHFSLMAVNYVTKDSPAQVLAFYRKSLSRYGEVLECDHGKPVGSPTTTRSGLTCGHVNDSDNTNSYTSTNHEIRAGSPHQFRIAGIDESHSGSTRFVLVYLEVPKDSDKKAQ